MQSFLQFVIIGLGAGATYALFAQGAVLIYRGSGLVNFAQGALGTLAALRRVHRAQGRAQLQDAARLPRRHPRGGRGGAAVPAPRAADAPQRGRHRARHRHRRPARRWCRPSWPSATATPTCPSSSSCRTTCGPGARCGSRRSGSTWSPISLAVTAGLWAWTRYTRTGLAISASAENERAVQTLGWSPDRLAALTWGLGGGLAGLAAVLVAPLTGPVGADPDDGGHGGRARRRAARRVPLVPADLRRRPHRRPRRVARPPATGATSSGGSTRTRSPG